MTFHFIVMRLTLARQRTSSPTDPETYFQQFLLRCDESTDFSLDNGVIIVFLVEPFDDFVRIG